MEEHEKLGQVIEFTVRLSQDDFDPVTRAWRFPALELPGASVKEVYADGERVDPEKYRFVGKQMRWVPGDTFPEKLLALVRVDGESRDEIFQSRDKAKRNEDRWKKFAIVVPLITAVLGAAVTLYINRGPKASSTAHTLTMRVVPTHDDEGDSIPFPKISLNGEELLAPYTTSLKGDTTALIDLSAADSLMSEYRVRDFEKMSFLRKIGTRLDLLEANLATASMDIRNSCGGGSSVQTAGNGPGSTISLVDGARRIATELKLRAKFLETEPMLE